MDFINLYTTNPQTIRQIVNSSNFTTHKLNEKKDIFRIGKKSVKVIANRSIDGRHYERLKITIKPHYYYNNDIHNGNYFPTNDTIAVVKEIADKLNIADPTKIMATSMEYGINMIPDLYDTKEIVNQSLYYKKSPFLINYSHLPYFKNTRELGKYPTVGVKLYHKGIQYPDLCHQNTFRYENYFSTARKLKKTFNIHSLSDFFNTTTYKLLSDYLIDSWQYVLILDEINEEVSKHSTQYYKEERHYRNGISNAKRGYYLTDGHWHKELRELIKYTLEKGYLKMQIPTLIDSWNTHKENIFTEYRVTEKTYKQNYYFNKFTRCLPTRGYKTIMNRSIRKKELLEYDCHFL